MIEWRDIPGYEGKYQAGINGIIRSLNFGHHGAIKELKGRRDKKGYLRVALYQNGVPHNYKVHRLIAMVFIPNPESKPQVNHKDGVKAHNWVDNLEWSTDLENMSHAWEKGLRDGFKLIMAKQKSKPVQQLSLDNQPIAIFPSALEAAKSLGLATPSNIGAVCYGRRNKAGGYKWRFLKAS
jgi:hypothetical protein